MNILACILSVIKTQNTFLEKQIYHYAKKLIACYTVLRKNVDSSLSILTL